MAMALCSLRPEVFGTKQDEKCSMAAGSLPRFAVSDTNRIPQIAIAREQTGIAESPSEPETEIRKCPKENRCLSSWLVICRQSPSPTMSRLRVLIATRDEELVITISFPS